MKTLKDLENEVRKIASENPDFVYPRTPTGKCVYIATETLPQCIIGKALTNLGIKIWSDWEGMTILSLVKRGEMPLMGLDPSWLMSVQNAQDQGHQWGRAVKLADAKAYHLARLITGGGAGKHD